MSTIPSSPQHRDLIPFFIPTTSTTPPHAAPILNTTLTPFTPPTPHAPSPPPPTTAATPRVWDKATGFFVDAGARPPASPSHTPSPPARRGRKNPRGAAPSPARPAAKRFAGCTFDAASPPPDALPLPSFAARPRAARPRDLAAELDAAPDQREEAAAQMQRARAAVAAAAAPERETCAVAAARGSAAEGRRGMGEEAQAATGVLKEMLRMS